MITNFENTGRVLFSGRNEIRLVNIDGEDVVVKRFKRPNLFQKIIYTFFRKNKAYKSYHNGVELVARGFCTPRPIRYEETKRMGLIDYCYYISSYMPLPPMEDWSDRDDWDAEMATRFAQFVARLHTKGVLHNDLNDTNVRTLITTNPLFVIPTERSGGVNLTSSTREPSELSVPSDDMFCLIDINRMQFYPQNCEIPLKERLRNLTRFTGRLDLFEFVVREYAKTLALPIEETVNLALKIKTTHDRNWYRRKRFTGFFKKMFHH